MIEVNYEKVILDSLHEGETVKDAYFDKMSRIACSFMSAYWRSLKQEWFPSEYITTYQQFIAHIKHDETLRRKFHERWRRHMIGYTGEVAVHHILGNDWREIFEFNDVHDKHQPDGFIGADSYNVKTREKNKWGLSVYDDVLQEKFYVLAHYAASCVRLVGYALAGELEEHVRDRRGHYWMHRKELHRIEYFSPRDVAEGLMYKCGKRWNVVSKVLP
jgi:hypothetical protein